MPEHKGGKYQRRSSSSDSNHRRSRDRRGEKEAAQPFERHYRRSRSRSKDRLDQKSKYGFQFVHKDDKKHYDYRREAYSSNFERKREGDRREREEFSSKPKYPRPEEKDPRNRLQESRFKEKDIRYEKRETKRNDSSSRERKRRFSSSSSHSSKQQTKNDIKFTYNKRSPEKLREKQAIKHSKHSSDSEQQPKKEIRNEQKPRFFPPPPNSTARRFESVRPPFVDHFHRVQQQRPPQSQRWDEQKSANYPIKQERNLNSYQRSSFSARPPFIPAPPKINFRPSQDYRPRDNNFRRQTLGTQNESRIVREEEAISPLKRHPSEAREIRPQQIARARVSKVDMLLNEARQNLTVSPPATSFLMLETYKTMNKFHIETLDQKWVSQLKGELETKYVQLREAVLGKLQETSEEGSETNCGLFMWLKEEIEEREQEVRSQMEQLRQLSSSLGQLVRRMKLVE